MAPALQCCRPLQLFISGDSGGRRTPVDHRPCLHRGVSIGPTPTLVKFYQHRKKTLDLLQGCSKGTIPKMNQLQSQTNDELLRVYAQAAEEHRDEQGLGF